MAPRLSRFHHAATAIRTACFPCRLHRGDSWCGEGYEGAVGTGAAPLGDQQGWPADAVPDGLSFVAVAPPAKWRDQSVIELCRALNVADLYDDVMEHLLKAIEVQGFGVQRKNRTASTRPASPQAATASRLNHSTLNPVVSDP